VPSEVQTKLGSNVLEKRLLGGIWTAYGGKWCGLGPCPSNFPPKLYQAALKNLIIVANMKYEFDYAYIHNISWQ
jgi:hypothetical protein